MSGHPLPTVQFTRGAAGALWREKRWTREAILARQQQALAVLWTHARAHSVFWRQRLGDTVDLSTVPPLTKALLMEHFEDALAVPALSLARARHLAVEDHGRGLRALGLVGALTSGTTGEVGCFVHDVANWDLMRGLLFARTLRHRLGPGDLMRFGPWRRYRMGFVVAMAGPYVTWLLARDEPWPARLLMNSRMFDVEMPAAQLRDAVQHYQPHYLHAYATSLEVLAHEQLAGRLHISPEMLSTGSEPLTPSARDVLTRAFPNAQLAQTYGATECPAMAVECRFGAMHINEDVCILEAVDEHSRPVPDGTTGARLLVTNLLNQAQPLLRYELGDRVTLQPVGSCPCGSPLRVLQVEGRVDDTLILLDQTGARQPHPPIPLEVVFLGVPGLRQFQLVHIQQNHLVANVTILPDANGDDVTQHLHQRFRSYLERHHLEAVVQVDVRIHDQLARDPRSHKLRQVHNLVTNGRAIPTATISTPPPPA